MQKKSKWKFFLSIIIVLIFTVGASGAIITVNSTSGPATVETNMIEVLQGEGNHATFVSEDIQYLSKSGEPQIPWKAMTVLLPPNADMATVSCSVISAEYETIEGVWDVAPVPPIMTRDADGNEIEIWPAEKTIVDGHDTDIYSADVLWPGEDVQLTGRGKLRGWRLAEIAVPLVRYNPVSGELQRLVQAEISVDCDKKGKAKGRSASVRQDVVKGRRRGHNRARKLAVNFDDAVVVYEASDSVTKSIQTDAPASDDGVLSVSATGAGYVIITTNDIRANSTKLADFVAHKQTMGFTVTVIDEDDTGATEVGDPAATKLREWLQANYIAMDMKYALIIGDPRPDEDYVPMKLYPCDTRNIPTDYFYAELTADWDANGNGIIGEEGEIERYFEVYVGRIPYYGVIADTDAILQKTINYETDTDTQWRRNTLISNVPLDSNMHGYNWGEQIKHDLLEPRAISSDRVYRDGYGHTVTNYDISPPPEFPASAYPATVWSQGQYGLHVWSTHGWAKGASGIASSNDAPNLNDNYPSTVFQGSCENAYPYNSDNLSYSLLKNGGIVTLGATRNSYYYNQTEFSNSPTDCGLSYRYAKGIVEGKSCGEALWELKEEISSWWKHNWTLFNPYGDPSVVVMPEALGFTITPTDCFYTVKLFGQLPGVADRSYLLKNNGNTTLNWTAEKNADWVTVQAAGSISAGGSAFIDITLNSLVKNLPVGQYTDTVVFTDVTNGKFFERDVVLIVESKVIAAYWKFDETSGSTAYDSSGLGNNGVIDGSSFVIDGVSGKYNGALNLDGGTAVELENLNINTNTMSITAWVKTASDQTDWTGIVFNRYDDAAGLNIAAGNQLRYHWGGSASTYNWSSGLYVPNNQWVFIAMVVKTDRTNLYMNTNGTMQMAVNLVSNNIESFGGITYIGQDPYGGRHFKGAIDDVRIYNYTLTDVMLEDIYQGGRAENPRPYDGAEGVSVTSLGWVSNATAVNHDVYIGSSFAAVANATKTSPEYKGSTSGTSFDLDTVKFFTDYFWRTDCVDSSDAVIAGNTWKFSTGDGTGAITREVWTGISGNAVSDLTSDPGYPDNPDVTGTLSSFEGPTDWTESYGTRIHGFLVPSDTGNYTFWVAGDDNCQLWLSSDSEPENAVQIAQVSGWTGPRQWNKYSQQQSTQVALKAGHPYYIMALHKEGGGGDNVAVAWQGPGISQQVIAGSYLMPYSDAYDWGLQFSSDPMVKSMAIEGFDYGDTLDGDATALDGSLDTVTFAKIAGPGWLDVASDGTLSGVAGNDDVGVNYFTIRATLDYGGYADAGLQITTHDTFTGELGLTDFASLAAAWLSSGCVDVPACNGADLTGDGNVNTADLQQFADMWLIDYGTGTK